MSYAFEVNTSDRVKAQSLAKAVMHELQGTSLECRMVFALEVTRALKEEIAELKRRVPPRLEK